MANRAVQILINARDQASAPLKQVQNTVRSVAATVRRVTFAAPIAALNGLRAAVTAAIGSMLKLAVVFAPFLALAGAVRTLTQSLSDFGAQEAALRNLGTTLELVGANAKAALPDLSGFASELQQITTIGDEVTLALMRDGLMLGIDPSQIKGATQAAIGLSESLGLDLNMAMRAVANANEGQYEVLNRYLPALRTATDDTEKLAIVNEAAARGFELAKSQTQTYAGAMQQLWNAVGDTREVLGEALAPAIMKVASFIRGILPTIEAWIRKVAGLGEIWTSVAKVISTYVNAVAKVFRAGFNLVVDILGRLGVNIESVSGGIRQAADFIVKAINFVARGFVTVFATITAVLDNWRTILDTARLAATLTFIKIVEELKHQLTINAPRYLQWLADTMSKVFGRVAVNTVNVLADIGKGVAEFATKLPGLLSGAITLEDALPKLKTTLTSGVGGVIADAMRELPQTVERTATPVENILSNMIAGRTGGIVDGIKESVAKALEDFDASGGLINPEDLAASIFIGLTGKAQETIDKGITVNARTGVEESRFLSLGPRIQQEPAVATAKNTEQQLKLSAKLLPAMLGALDRIEALTANAPRIRIGGFGT